MRVIAAASPAASVPAAAALVAAGVSLAAWYAALAALPDVGLAPATALVHAAGVAAQLVVSLLEAACLVRIASAARVRLPYARTVAALLVLSLLQAVLLQLQALGWEHAEWRAWLAPLAGHGVHLPPGTARDGFATATSQMGLLALARVGGTAEWLRANGLPRRLGWTSVLACYCAVRLLTWWCADLLRGMSPLG